MGFGTSRVSSRMRVPRPAASRTALRIEPVTGGEVSLIGEGFVRWNAWSNDTGLRRSSNEKICRVRNTLVVTFLARNGRMPKRDLGGNGLHGAWTKEVVLQMNVGKAVRWLIAQLDQCLDERIEFGGTGEANVHTEMGRRAEELAVGSDHGGKDHTRNR